MDEKPAGLTAESTVTLRSDVNNAAVVCCRWNRLERALACECLGSARACAALVCRLNSRELDSGEGLRVCRLVPFVP